MFGKHPLDRPYYRELPTRRKAISGITHHFLYSLVMWIKLWMVSGITHRISGITHPSFGYYPPYFGYYPPSLYISLLISGSYEAFFPLNTVITLLLLTLTINTYKHRAVPCR